MLVVATATHKEMRAALRLVPGAAMRTPEPGTWERFDAAGRQVLALVTGVSVVNAGLSLGGLLQTGQVSGVLNLGVAGSFDTQALPLGAVAVARAECWPEYGVQSCDEFQTNGELRASEPLADASALGWPLHRDRRGSVEQVLDLDPDAARRAMDLALDPAWTRGLSLTVSTVTATAARAHVLRRRHGALTENMEGFALALGCRRADVPFLEIRAASNAVGPRQGTWDLEKALDSLGSCTAALLGVTA